jgi:hypothetical protein
MKKDIQEIVMWAEEILGVSLTKGQIELIEQISDSKAKNLPIIAGRKRLTPNTIPSVVQQYYELNGAKTTFDLKFGHCYIINGKPPIVVTRITTNLKTGNVRVTGYSPGRYVNYLKHTMYDGKTLKTIGELEGVPYPIETHIKTKIECEIKEIADVKF